MYINIRLGVLEGSSGNLRSNDPALQVMAVLRLRSMLWWGMYDNMAQRIVDQGLLQELVALIRPGSNAGEASRAGRETGGHQAVHGRLCKHTWALS